MRQLIGIFGSMLKVFMTTAVLVPALATSALAYWTITDLGQGSPHGINNSGQVTGTYYPTSGSIAQAFLYTPGIGMQNLGTLGGLNSQGFGINNSGQVTGASQTADGSVHPFIYTPGTPLQDLGALSGTYSVGSGINNSGQVTGGYFVTGNTGTLRAFLYTPGTGLQDIGILSGDTSGYGINDSGQVTGVSGGHAFLYTPGIGMQDIGTLGGDYSEGDGINKSGQITGLSADHAFLYTPGTPLQDLGTLSGNGSQGYSINDSGQITGAYIIPISGIGSRAFLYSNGKMTDLNTLIDPSSGWTLQEGHGINDLGQIVGIGLIDGQTHAFLMTPALAVTIDIEPGFKPNIIDPNLKWAPIPVAILSTPSFNALRSVKWDSLTFGHSGNEKSLAFCSPLSIDVNGDKAPDLICFFYTGQAAFQCGDTQGILKGQTKDGTPIQGSDSVKIVPCK